MTAGKAFSILAVLALLVAGLAFVMSRVESEPELASVSPADAFSVSEMRAVVIAGHVPDDWTVVVFEADGDSVRWTVGDLRMRGAR